MWIEGESRSMPVVALAPVAVLPAWQRRGIGGLLIRDGLERLHDDGERIVIVVGHPKYYPRFGFRRPDPGAIEHPFPVEAFMARELTPHAFDGIRGRVKYPSAFGL
jgi:putative acetyltransferase